MIKNELHSLWIGDKADWIEKLCMKTWMAHGHKAVLWTYGPVAGLPEGVEIRDAREIAPEDMITRHTESNSTALFSDYFRYAMLNKFPVTWVDTDVFLFQPMPLDQPYLFGYEPVHQINTAVLRAPSDSRFLRELIDFYLSPAPIPFWFRWDRKLRYRIQAALGHPRTRETMHWGTFGPGAVEAYAKKLGLLDYASAFEVFYPVACDDIWGVFETPEVIDAKITPNTVSLHFCSGRIRASGRIDSLSPDSWLAREFKRYGVTP